MKKIPALLLAVLMTLGMAACSSSDPATPSSTSAAPAATTKAPAGETFTFKVTFASSADTVFGKKISEAYKKVAERSDGTLNFEIYPSSQLGSTAETLEQMLSGMPVIACLGFDNTGDYVPELGVASAPYVFQDAADVFKLVKTDWMAGVEKKMHEKNFAPLAYGSLGYRHFIGTKPIRKASDITGMIVRMGNSSLAQNFITVMGGSPTTSSWADNYASLQQGIFDACEASLDLLYTSSLYEVCDYLTLSGHFVTPTILTMNTDYWNKLSADQQKIIREELQGAMRTIYDEMAAAEETNVQKFKDKGVEIIEVDKSEFASYVPELLKKLNLNTAVYDDIQAAIKG